MYVCSLGEVCFSRINADVPNEVSPSPAPMTGATTSTPGFERGAVRQLTLVICQNRPFFCYVPEPVEGYNSLQFPAL